MSNVEGSKASSPRFPAKGIHFPIFEFAHYYESFFVKSPDCRKKRQSFVFQFLIISQVVIIQENELSLVAIDQFKFTQA